MREEKLNFGIIIRVFVSLLPILLGLPTLATIFCAYNLVMSFIVFGPLTAFVSSLCAVCISMFLGSSYGTAAELSGLVWAMQAILCGAGCIYGISYKKKFYHGLSFASLGMLVPQFLYTQYRAHADGLTVAQALVPPVEDVKMMMNEMLGQQIIDSEMIDKIAAMTQEITTILIPSALITSSMVLAYVVLWAVSAQLRRLPFGMVHSFSHIKVSKMTVIFIPVLFVLTVIGFNNSNTMLATAALNMLIILLTMCFFAGISLADFYVRRFIPFTFLRLIVHVLVSLNGFPVYILAAFVDAFANFRKLPIDYKKRGEAHETEE